MSVKNQNNFFTEKPVLRVKPSSVATFLFLAFAAIVLAYVAGVMSGRHQPEMMGKKTVIETGGQITEEKAPTKEDMLTAEQLEFARVLRGEVKSAPQTPPIEAAAPVKEAEPAPAEKKVDNAPVVVDSAPETEKFFDYVFQVGAFRDENAADSLRQKLEGYGLRTGMEKNGKMFIVLVRMRATPQRAAELGEIAAKLRLGEPLVKSRKQATP